MNDCCRDALTPVLAICDEVEHMGWGSASDYDKGGQRCAERIRAAVEIQAHVASLSMWRGLITPDQPEPDDHRTQWAVLSDDGQTYEVAGKARETASREAGMLREKGELGARVVERRLCEWTGTYLHEPAAAPYQPGETP